MKLCKKFICFLKNYGNRYKQFQIIKLVWNSNFTQESLNWNLKILFLNYGKFNCPLILILIILEKLMNFKLESLFNTSLKSKKSIQIIMSRSRSTCTGILYGMQLKTKHFFLYVQFWGGESPRPLVYVWGGWW
jgi:hypothetical protein